MYSRKGISHHFMYLLIISVLLGTLITFGLGNTFLTVDDPRCDKIDFEVSSKCLKETSTQLKINNKGTKGFTLRGPKGEHKIKPTPDSNSKKVFLNGKFTSFDLVPIIKYPSETIVCNGKEKSVEVYEKC